jgi:hypothetical protein
VGAEDRLNLGIKPFEDAWLFLGMVTGRAVRVAYEDSLVLLSSGLDL